MPTTTTTAITRKMTLQYARQVLRERGVVLKKTGLGNEFRVNFKGGAEATAYYTDNLHDAVHTGLDMIRRSRGYGSLARIPRMTLPAGYSMGPSPKSPLKQNVYRREQHIGTVMQGGKTHFHWWLRYAPHGKTYHPHGETPTLREGIRAIIIAAKGS